MLYTWNIACDKYSEWQALKQCQIRPHIVALCSIHVNVFHHIRQLYLMLIQIHTMVPNRVCCLGSRYGTSIYLRSQGIPYSYLYSFLSTNIHYSRVFAVKTSTNTRKYQTCILAPIGPENLKYTRYTNYMSNIHRRKT